MLLHMLGNSMLLYPLGFVRVVLGVLKRGFRVLLLLQSMPWLLALFWVGGSSAIRLLAQPDIVLE
jgi:hypothetical protein